MTSERKRFTVGLDQWQFWAFLITTVCAAGGAWVKQQITIADLTEQVQQDARNASTRDQSRMSDRAQILDKLSSLDSEIKETNDLIRVHLSQETHHP